MEYFYDSAEFLNRSKISEKEKEQLFFFVKDFIDVYLKIQNSDKSALEEEFVIRNYLLYKGLYYIYLYKKDISKYMYYIQKMIINYILSGNYRGVEFIKKIMILEGINSISNQQKVKIFQEKLLSICGEKFRKDYMDTMKPSLESI